MSQTIKVTGTFLGAGKTRTWGDGHSSTKIYIDTDPDSKYSSQVEMEVYKENVNLNEFSQGDKVEVSINFKGKKSLWKGKETFFNSIDAWKMEKTGGTPVDDPLGDSAVNGGGDDLPF